MRNHKTLTAPQERTNRTKRTRPRAKNALNTIEKRIASGKKRFLKELRKCNSVLLAAERANLGRRTVYEWREDDPQFAVGWDNTLELAREDLKASVHEEAVKTGGNVAVKIFAAKGYFPEFREKTRLEDNPELKKIASKFGHIMRKYIPRDQLKNAFIEFCELTGFNLTEHNPFRDGGGPPTTLLATGLPGPNDDNAKDANSAARNGAADFPLNEGSKPAVYR